MRRRIEILARKVSNRTSVLDERGGLQFLFGWLDSDTDSGFEDRVPSLIPPIRLQPIRRTAMKTSWSPRTPHQHIPFWKRSSLTT